MSGELQMLIVIVLRVVMVGMKSVVSTWREKEQNKLFPKTIIVSLFQYCNKKCVTMLF
jgi:hypothetical protein